MISIKQHNKGVALLLVLWVLVLLSVIAGEFAHTMRVEVNITRNFMEQTRAYYIARGGIHQAIGYLVAKATFPESVLSQSVQDQIPWRINGPIPPVPVADGYALVHIDNEMGKVHLNYAQRKTIRMMLNGLDIDDRTRDVIADSILDWRDKDSLTRLNGAENDYYHSLQSPYDCGNREFKSVRELLRVRGVTPELFFHGLQDMVTVYPLIPKPKKEKRYVKKKKETSKIKKIDFDRININAAPPVLLRALPAMTPELADQIIAYRKTQDIDGYAGLIPIVGNEVYTEILPWLTLKMSPVYTIRSIGTLDGSKVRQQVTAVIQMDPKQEKKYRILQWIDGVDGDGWGSEI